MKFILNANLKLITTVKLVYNEHGYSELPVIANR
jgi:hypothetical protein